MAELVRSEIGHEAAAMLTDVNGPDAAFMDGAGAMGDFLVLRAPRHVDRRWHSEIKRNQFGERILGLPRDPLIT